MGQNFLLCDREQELLLAPSLREWLPPDHLAWFVIDLVEELDTDAFYAAYRADGHGRAAHDPSMMLALLVYGYSVGERSSRRIQRRCVEDVSFRVIAVNQVPDHATIGRFRRRHEQALGALFGQVLELCARAGLVHLDLIAVDGTKIAANASRFANRTYEQLAREIIGEAVEVDAAEDAEHGKARGDEMPAQFANEQGRRGWIREARKELERHRDEQPSPVPGPRPARLAQARRRLLEDHQTKVDANAAYEAYRAGGKDKTGRGFGRPPNPVTMPGLPAGRSTSAIPIATRCALRAARRRPTTPRRSAPGSRSSSPPRSRLPAPTLGSSDR